MLSYKAHELKKLLKPKMILTIITAFVFISNLSILTPFNAMADTSILDVAIDPNSADPMESFNMTVEAQDTDDVEVDLSVLGGPNNYSLDYDMWAQLYEGDFDAPQMLSGVYALTFTATGSTGPSSVTADITINNVAPVVNEGDVIVNSPIPGSDLTIEAGVSDDNTLSDISLVYADLADIVGGPGVTVTSIELYDDGTHGDVTSDDGTYSNNFIPIPNDTATGDYDVEIVVEDQYGLRDTATKEVTISTGSDIESAGFDPNVIDPLDETLIFVFASEGMNVTVDLSSIGGVNNQALTYSQYQNQYQYTISEFPEKLSGDYDFTVTANGSNEDITITVNNVAPTVEDVSIVAQSPGVDLEVEVEVKDENTLNDISSVYIDMADIVAGPGVTVTTVDLYDDGTHGDATPNDGIYTNNSVPVPDDTIPGNYDVDVVVEDQYGLTDIYTEVINIEGSLEITSADFVPGAGLPGITTTINAIITPQFGFDSIASVTVDLDAFGGNIQNLLDQGNGSYSLSDISVPAMGAGAYSFEVSATDDAGGITTTDAIFNIQNDPIGIAAVSAFPSVTDPNTEITVEVELSDANGVTDVSYVSVDLSSLILGGGAVAETIVYLPYVSTSSDPVLYRFSSDISIPEGVAANTYTLDIEAQDNSGSTAQSTTSVEVLNVSTTITSAAFSPSQGIPGVTTTLSVSVEDLNGLGDITDVVADLSFFNAGVVNLIDQGDGVFSLSDITVPTGIAGITSTLVTAYSGATSLDDRNVNFTILNDAPTIDNINVSNATLVAGNTSQNIIELDVSDLNGDNDIELAFINMSAIGGEVAQSFIIDPQSIHFDYLNAGLGTPAGTYVLPISVSDSAGAVSTSSTSVYVENGVTVITSAYFSPSSVKPSSNEYIRLSVNIVDVNGLDDLSVTADLSALGLSSYTQLNDNGTGGDLVANDGVFTVGNMDLSANINPGNYTVDITVDDGEDEIFTTADIEVLDNDALTIDQVSPTYGSMAGGESVLIKIDNNDINFFENQPTVSFISGANSENVNVEIVVSENEFYVMTPVNFQYSGLIDIEIVVGGTTILRENAFEFYNSVDFPGITISGVLGISEGSTSTLTVNLTEIVEVTTVVNLFNNNPSYITIPATVTIPAGYRMVDFTMTALEEDSDYEDNVALISAGTSGFIPTQKVFSILDNDNSPLSVSPSTSNIDEEGTLELYASILSPSSEDLTIDLLSSNINILSVPASIDIPAGETGQSFTVMALNDVNDTNDTATITLTADGYSSTIANLTIIDNDDNTAPTVTSVTPSNLIRLPIWSDIVVTFSEGILADNIDNIISLNMGETAVTSTYTYNSATYQVTVNPVNSLNYSTSYTLDISSSLEDLSGNTLASDYSLSFFTESYDDDDDDDDDDDRRRRRTYYYNTQASTYGYQYPSTTATGYNTYTGYNYSYPYTSNAYYQYQGTYPNTYSQYGYQRNYYPSYNEYPGQGYYTQGQQYKDVGQVTNMTRAEYIKQLLVSRGVSIIQGQSSPFRDVKLGHPYNDYIATAATLGMLNTMGGTNNTFRPYDFITTGEISQISSVL